VRPRHQGIEVVDRHRVVLPRRGGDGHDLLGEHVQRVARHHGRLDLRLAHAPRDHRALEQIGAELREDPPPADVADRVPGPPDALQAAGHRLGRLDLDDQIHRSHVDPQLQAGGSHQARQLAGLEHLLHHRALLARQ
jgi:hypothetical protein